MKKMMRIASALLMALVLLSMTAYADDTKVNFVGGAENFVFVVGANNATESDLFDNFKNVLPGDTIEQKIRVENNSDMVVRVYLRAEPVAEAFDEFLNQMNLTVVSGSDKIFEAAANEQAGLTNYRLLGTFKKQGGTDLTVTLEVPIEMGNEFMAQMGEIPWTFMVEEVPPDTTPDTGDWFQASSWIALAAVLAALLICLILGKKFRRAEQ